MTINPTIAGTIFVLFILAASFAVLMWPHRQPRRWTPPETGAADLSREREALLSAAHRIGLFEGVREDLLGELERFAESLAARVASGRTVRAVAIHRITCRARKLAGPNSASAAALAIGAEDAT
jgi:hypothetical protein